MEELFRLLEGFDEDPPLYERRGELFWKDPWCSGKSLEIQLDPAKPEGARTPEVAEAQVGEILGLLPTVPKVVLDLGCGPGFHAAALAQRGCAVSALDVSPAAAAYARSVAEAMPPGVASRIALEEAEMLSAAWEEGGYDLITLLFGEFGLLTPEERATFLRKARKAVSPEGRVVLELFHQPTSEAITDSSWSFLGDGGFWSPEPYLELNRTVSWVSEEVLLHRFLIVRPDRESREIRIWETSMDEHRIAREAEAASLRLEKLIWDHPLFDGGGGEEGRRWFVAVLAAVE